MRSYTTEGIVIKRSNFGEAGKLITLFTKDQGKVTLIARGLRKLSSKRAGSLELFNLVKFHAVQGKTSLDTLTEVQFLNSFPSWKKHLGRITLAYQLCEAIDKLTPDREPHPEIFAILKNSLFEIGKLKIDWKLKIEDWLIEISRELGYWPRDQKFSGDIYSFLETITSRPLHSPKLLNRLK